MVVVGTLHSEQRRPHKLGSSSSMLASSDTSPWPCTNPIFITNPRKAYNRRLSIFFGAHSRKKKPSAEQLQSRRFPTRRDATTTYVALPWGASQAAAPQPPHGTIIFPSTKQTQLQSHTTNNMSLASRALSSKDLPPSVESAYYRKCIDLRRRITDIEDSNDGTRLRITRLSRGIQKMRLERAFLLEQLNKHMEYNVDDSDRSSSPPPTPTDKPLRSKRSHNRKGTPPLGGSGSAGGAETERERLGVGQGALEGRMIQHGVNTMSSAQSTPDPAGRQERGYFGTIGAGASAGVTAAATSPHTAVNGVPPPPTLPPLHSLPPLQPQQPATSATTTTTTTTRPYFDPAYDEQRPAPASGEEDGARRRAYSGAAQQPPATDSAPPPPLPLPQNGDTEMTDASFTSVNRA